jgi:hypothetical protein
VPTISRFRGIAISMYHDDHGFPHFHADHADGYAKVRIDDLTIIEGNLPIRQLRLVRRWAAAHQQELLKNWRRARARGTLEPIEPLR